MDNKNYENIQRLFKSLKDHSIDIRIDDLSKGIYATDASLYQLEPLAVCIPKTEEQLILIIKKCYEYKLPILPRGSATSLAGQTTNHAVVIDFTKFFNNILEINYENNTARVQSGVTRDQLNKTLYPHGIQFAPDPATSSRATIGGMVANNSSGTKSIKYGKTIDHVHSMRLLLVDGTVLELKDLSMQEWEQKCSLQTEEGYLYRKFREVIYSNFEAIASKYPKVMRRVQGYPLDEFTKNKNWNLAKLICGSEGTLGIILEVTLNLVKIEKYKTAFTVHYSDRMQAIKEVHQIVQFDPVAVEMLDYNVFKKSKYHPLTKEDHQKIIIGNPEATLTVEFFGDSQDDLSQKVDVFNSWVNDKSKAYAAPRLSTEEELVGAWNLRKNGLGLIMGDPNGRKPIPFIEDAAIPLESLSDYIQEVLDLCDKYGVETILYAHASVGVLHVRPSLDISRFSDVQLMKTISDEVFDLVIKYGGSWSGEHGDGRNRGHKLKEFFGEEVYGCLQQIKEIFDPHYLLNPGIIIHVPPIDHHLRRVAKIEENKHTYHYNYKTEYGFETIVNNCSGVGACRNHFDSNMCPSFKATSEERHSTRGRANALRLALNKELGFDDITDPKVLESLDLCISCKACKTECPSNVDMSKLKSEVLQKVYDKKGIPFQKYPILYSHKIAKIASGRWAGLVNTLLTTSIFKVAQNKVLGITQRRNLPKYAKMTLKHWYTTTYVKNNHKKKVALFLDTYINYHDVHIGILAINLLQHFGYEVELADVGCCQRPRISNGFLRKAKVAGRQTLKSLGKYLDNNIPVLVIEPSCASALVEDLIDLVEDNHLTNAQKKIQLLDEYILEYHNQDLNSKLSLIDSNFIVHTHCHQKALFENDAVTSILKSFGVQVEAPITGCCGMAGSFGYEKEHYDMSVKIAEAQLLPSLRKSEGVVIANGFSCRHQIDDLTAKKPKHWLEVLELKMA